MNKLFGILGLCLLPLLAFGQGVKRQALTTNDFLGTPTGGQAAIWDAGNNRWISGTVSATATNAINNQTGFGTNTTLHGLSLSNLTANRVLGLNASLNVTNLTTSRFLLDNFFAMGISNIVASDANIAIGTNNGTLFITNTVAGGLDFGNVLFVRTNGNDSTAVRGRLDKPYSGLRTARAAAIAGDLIDVGPGVYTICTNLLKNLVNWHFRPGAVLSNHNNGTVPMGIWDNTGFGTAGAVISTITGDGVFIQRGGWDETPPTIGMISLVDSATRLDIECRSILTSADSSTYYAIAQHEGRLRLNVKEGIDTAYGPTETGATFSKAGGWWWANTVYAWGSLSTPKFLTDGASAFYSIASGPGDFFATVEYVYSTNSTTVWLEPTHTENKFWLSFKELKGGTNMISRGTVLSMAGGKFYGSGQKISAFYNGGTETNLPGYPLIGLTNGIAWVNIQKAEITNKSFFVEHIGVGGVLNLNSTEYSDLGCDFTGINSTNSRPYNFNFGSGTNRISGGHAVTTWGPGAKITGGEVEFKGFKMNTFQNLKDTNHTFWVTGGNLILDNVTAITGGTNSVFASSAQNIRVYGTLVTRSNIAPAVTMLSGDILINENVDR